MAGAGVCAGVQRGPAPASRSSGVITQNPRVRDGFTSLFPAAGGAVSSAWGTGGWTHGRTVYTDAQWENPKGKEALPVASRKNVGEAAKSPVGKKALGAGLRGFITWKTIGSHRRFLSKSDM